MGATPTGRSKGCSLCPLVNDPGGHRGWGSVRGQTKEQAKVERERLFGIIRELVQWENSNNEAVLEKARVEIRKSWAETCTITGEDPTKMPPVLDPFAGGGTIPLEAQRLGMEAHASDLNPIPVLINKALIELPHKYAGIVPVSSGNSGESTVERTWPGASGLAEDVRNYGKWMRDEAWKRIGHLYPQTRLPQEYGGDKADVIAWIWARTVPCPNPACRCEMPLLSTFELYAKPNERAYLRYEIDRSNETPRVKFHVAHDMNSKESELASLGCGVLNAKGKAIKATFRCLACETAVKGEYINDIAMERGLGSQLVAVVAAGRRSRIYLDPPPEQMLAISFLEKYTSDRKWLESLPNQSCRGTYASNAQGRVYGFKTFKDYFTTRQLVTLTTYCDLLKEVRSKITLDAREARFPADGTQLTSNSVGASAYAEAVSVYLALGVSRMSDYNSSLVCWSPTRGQVKTTFSRQAISMAWDFAEVNPFADAAGDLNVSLSGLTEALSRLHPASIRGQSVQANAALSADMSGKIISTDPPYYDNIGYADLSDFFYVWIRRSLLDVYPEIFTTLLTPKSEELIADSYRHGGKDRAHKFFSDGISQALRKMRSDAHHAHPITIYYAFKQATTKDEGTASTGWVAFLQAVIDSGLTVTGTWPMHTERTARSVALDTNALASSIILVCRARPDDASSVTRRQFIKELNDQLPLDLEDMINGSIGISPVAPVDLAQAAIGPGMALFSQYSSVLEADGSAMTVYQALILINKAIDDYFDATEGRMDNLTRFCTRWFSSYGFSAGPYGEADSLSRACSVTVSNHIESVESGRGKTRLRIAAEHEKQTLPGIGENPSIWTSLHRLAGRLEAGDSATAGAYLARIPQHAADIRALAYRLYTICERSKLTEVARTYNNIISSWDAIVYGSEQAGVVGKQIGIFDEEEDSL